MITSLVNICHNWTARPIGPVPTIVPETRQKSAARANASQLDRFVKWKKVNDLR